MEKETPESESKYAVCVGGSHTPSELYNIIYKEKPTGEILPASGGDRVYTRLSSGPGKPVVIGTTGPDVAENKAFIRLSQVFLGHGIRVPEIYACDEGCRSYLQTDLGDDTLLPLLATERRMELAEASLAGLADIQTVDEAEWSHCVYSEPFSRRMVMWDLNYFKYEFAKPCGVPFDESRLEDDFEKFSGKVSSHDPELWGFMYRDFQSRNVIVKDGEPYFIDFQGGRKGPLLYDAVSFLWQAKAGFSKEERLCLLAKYAECLSAKRGVDRGKLLSGVGEMALLRTLQVLGAYGFRGLVEKRSHFIESIPAALANLKELLEDGVADEYPELKEVCRQLAGSRFAHIVEKDGLTVKIFSFSYKKGYPEDFSGNGGGFMFDCRGMHNPGRYDEFKPLTGLDKAVADFLEEKGEVQRFVDCAFNMVSPSVECYRRRGFSSLQIGFGCTGGRHRSVYCAQRLAERLASVYPDVRIELNHREQGITRSYNDNKGG